MDSDDSDFFGDAETVAGLQNRVDGFDMDAWERQQRVNPGRPKPRATLTGDISHLHNPYSGVYYAWQLTETVEDFLGRLPPETTTSGQVPWIFICNPYIPRIEKRHSDKTHGKGRENDNEAPVGEGSNVPIVIQAGMERLELVKSFTENIPRTNRTKTVMEREANQERKQAATDILNLAHSYKVRAGKWMLFCPPREVNEIWALVAKATAANELGVAAKVAPKSEMEDGKDRLICVYTADFKDKADVGRVLQKLRELRLIEARGRSIYYKPGELPRFEMSSAALTREDAYTYIGIASNNPWGVRASIYSSRDIF